MQQHSKRNDASQRLHRSIHSSLIWPATALSAGFITPALAEEGGHAAMAIDEVIVTARRKEESLQDVPISISVLNQQELTERNIVNAADLATYTPSLSANERFGSDNTSFAIRGFTQELRTTASVGVYFADVVAPRGGTNVTGGDGAGPGAFFDLQNVQVLKGPQGTLFGRNTTGGAVLLVPQKPKDYFEGYFEASAGDYNLQRAEGVINVPFSAALRGRFGVDYQERDGIYENASGIGPDSLTDLDYVAARASFVIDVTDTLENYTILTYTDSQNSGTVSKVFACNPAAGLGVYCVGQLAARPNLDFYELESTTPAPMSELEQSQAINTTTWNASDDFTVKNILSYARLDSTLRTSIFGTNWRIPASLPGIGGLPLVFANSDQMPGRPTNSQTALVEELQFQGRALDNDLVWQMGLYYENSKPDGFSGSQSTNQIYCADRPGLDPATFRCQDVLRQVAIITRGVNPGPVGSVQRQQGEVEYENKAVYAQATYDVSSQFKVTAGLRYTSDETTGTSQMVSYRGFSGTQISAPTVTGCINPVATLPDCSVRLRQKSDAPTWLIDFDYLPTDQVMLYAKYARGYRQGSVTLFGAEGFNTYDPEEVDAYEVGLKTSFGGVAPGTFNVAVFYNDLRDQQLQAGFRSTVVGGPAPTTGIVNAGESKIQGVEVAGSILLFEHLSFDLAYTYLDTELEQLDPPVLPPGNPFNLVTFTADVGGPLPLSPENKASATVTYRLPLSEQIGEVSLGATYVYTDEQNTAAPAATPFATLDDYSLLNLNLSWKKIAGSRVDASVFATNVTDEEYVVYVSGLYGSGFESANLGRPRMWGVRLRYNFGE